MADDRIVKFCAQIGPRSIYDDKLSPCGRDQGHVTLNFLTSVNISKTVQDRDTLTMED